jgi:hypothetical protein
MRSFKRLTVALRRGDCITSCATLEVRRYVAYLRSITEFTAVSSRLCCRLTWRQGLASTLWTATSVANV